MYVENLFLTKRKRRHVSEFENDQMLWSFFILVFLRRTKSHHSLRLNQKKILYRHCNNFASRMVIILFYTFSAIDLFVLKKLTTHFYYEITVDCCNFDISFVMYLFLYYSSLVGDLWKKLVPMIKIKPLKSKCHLFKYNFFVNF